jgi:hypothetical protein
MKGFFFTPYFPSCRHSGAANLIQFQAHNLAGLRLELDSLTSCCQKVKVTLRLTIGQSVSVGVEPHLGLMTRYLL